MSLNILVLLWQYYYQSMFASLHSLSLELQNSQYTDAGTAEIHKPKIFCLKKNKTTKIMLNAVYTVTYLKKKE